MKHIFRSKKAVGITSLVLATSVVLGTIAINRKKDGGVSVGIPTVNAADAYLSYDSASLVNYSSVLGRAVDFGIVTNRLEQRNHMETTYATNDFYNQKNDNCDVDLAGEQPAQFIIGSISGGKARFGYTYGAKNDYQTAPSMQFVIDTTPDLAASDLFTYDAGSFKGEALYRTFSEPELNSNVNGMIQHFKDESNKMLQHVAFDGDDVFAASTGAIDLSDECYKNTTLYINVQPGSRLESAIQTTEGLNIIKDPSTVVVFNILNTDYIKLAKYKVTSDSMTMDTYTDHSGNDTEKNKNIDKYITRKIIWNVPYAKSVDYDTTAGLFLVPNPDTTGTVTTSSAGWIAAAGTTVVKGGEFHYIFHDRSDDANTPDTSVMHFALRKAFVENGTPADQIKSKEIRNILVGAGEYTFTIEETDENYKKLTDSNAYTDEKSTDAYGKVAFKSISETVREVDPYNGKHRYFVIKEKEMAPGVDSHISKSNGEIRIDVLVTNVNGIIHYQVSSWKYADGNNLTDSDIIATNDKIDMSGTEFSLGGFYNFYNLKYAKMSVTKNVNVTGTDDFPADQKFNFALKIDGKYVQNEQGELGLTPRYFEITRDQKIDFTHLIPGTYTIEENPDDIQGFTFLSKEVQVGSSTMTNDQVVLGDDDDVAATLINNYQKVDIDGKYSLKVKKNVDVHFPAGMARDMSDFEGKEFRFTVQTNGQYVQDKNGTLGASKKVFTINYDTSVQGPGAVGNEFTIYGLDPDATYTVTEVRDQNYTGDDGYVVMPGYNYTSNANDTTKNVRLDHDGKRAEIVNKYDVQKGKLTVNKSFTLIDDNNANGSGSVDTTSLSNLNNLTFTIKGPLGFSKTLTYTDITEGRNVLNDVPAGKYTIIEENASDTSGGNYTFVRYSYVGADGTTSVASGGNQTITVYNQYRENYSSTEKGNITIAKSMDGAVAPAGSVFNFTIKNNLGEYCEFDDSGNFVGFSTTKTYASVTFNGGGYYTSREFRNIPSGTYIVEEEPTDEQKTLEGKNLNVEYMVDGVSTQSFKLENYGNKQVQVNNHYREYMLEVEKLVSGDLPYDYTQYDMEYSFVVKKGDQYVQPNGNLTGTAYTFKIKPNQKMQIPVTDAGDYQVIETTTEAENSLFTLTTTYSTVNGEVTLDSTNKDGSVIIHNEYTYKNKGSLEVKKEVADPTNSAPSGTEFTVGVKLNRTGAFDVEYPDGTTQQVAFEKDVVKEFTLKSGESIKINGLYAGTEYEVAESNIPSGFSLATDGIVYGNTDKKITKDTEDLVTVNNTYDYQEYFSLSVEKNWDDGNNQDGKRPAEVVVILKQDGNEIDRTTLNDSNNWTYTATNLPKHNGAAEYVYTWEEVPVADYTTTYSPAAPIPNGTTTITNSYTPETTSATVKKDWNDFGNAAGKRPTEIVMTLSNGDTVKLNAGNNWTATITGLPKYNNGVLINYTWTEGNMPQGYSQTDCTTLGTTTTIENTYDISLEKTTMKVTKVWDDNNDQDGMRPANLTVTLRRNNADFMTQTLNEANNWTVTLDNLAKFDDQGALYTYEWVEPAVTGYTSVSSGTVADRVFTNAHAPEKISLSVEKIWDDNNNQDGKRPADITVILKKDSADFMTFTLNDGNGWKETASDLDKYENGREIAYEWAEVTVPEYTTTTSEAKGVTTITNKHVPETVSVAVAKIWNDSNNQDGKRPASLNVTLKKDGSNFDVIELNDGNSWSYSRSDLPKYENGALIDYSWEEESVADYTSAKTGDVASTTFTNTHETEKVSLTVTKTWVNTGNSSAQPTSVVVDLLADGTPVGSVTLNDGNNWTDSIFDLPVYKNGVKINYEWKEQVPANYRDTYTGNGTASTTIKNTYDHSVERTTAKVTKIWDDSNNQDGKRPTEVEVQLMQNGVACGSSVMLTAPSWSYEATDLPKYDANGDEYTYTWEETPVTYYTLTQNDTVGTETTLKNSYTTETVSLKITKTWADADNKAGKRPASVDVKLLVNGTAGRTVTLTAAEGWTKEVTGLAKYSNGRAISYTWEEVVPADYTPAYSGNGTADAVINNSFDFSTVKTTAKVTKTWRDSNNQDGKRPTTLEVQLLQNGTAIGSSVTLEAASGWTYEATDLPMYDANGDEYAYTWQEVSVPAGYTLADNTTTGNATTIINAHTTETTSLAVTKTWVNTGNSSAQPASVNVDLYKGTTMIGTVTLDDSNNWTESIDDLPVYENGTKITYEWKEQVPSGYKATYTDNGSALTTIKNTYDFSLEKTSAKVTKIWDDSNNQDGKRPTSIQVQLKQNDTRIGSAVTLDASNNWTYEETDLPKYDANGDAYTYAWDEVSVPAGYQKSISTSGSVTTITNAHTAETTAMTVKKVWDNTGSSSAQPTSVVVELFNGATKVGSVTLNDGNNWTDSISGLPVYENGTKITYEWKEQVPVNYTDTYTGNGTASTTVTNTYNFSVEKTTAKVTKVWDDDNDRDGKRPTEVQVQLLRNGADCGASVKLEAASGWTYEETDLPKYDASGNAYSYTWKEVTVLTDYTLTGNRTSGTDTTLTNRHAVETTQLTVKKTWINTGSSSAQPASVTVDLFNGTTKVGTVVLEDANNWTDSISGLPVNENGSPITYEWKEQVPTNYKESYSVSGTTTTITNTFDISSEKTEATVKKVWDDNNNQDGKRPTEVTVRLLRNGTPISSDILLNDGNNWEYKAENLDKMDASGNAYAYTWEEDAVTGYSASKSESGTVTTFTNKHVPETKILTVEKIWDDANNVAGVRPTELVMTLSSGGSVTLNDGNNWTASVSVPVYANGSEIAYSWSEGTMPAGYTKESCVVNGNTTTFTNKFDLTTVKTSVSVAKVWDDNSDAAGARPTELIVSLSDGTQVVDQATLNDANGWKYTANDLAMYDASGNVITYTWSEGAMPSGYALTDTTVNAGVTTFTNTYTAPVQVKGSLKIEKVLGPDAPASAATKAYHFTVTCPDGSTIPVEIVGASYVELNDLALGDYKITEDEADAKISGYDLSILNNDATVTLTDAAQKSVTVTNNYTQQQTTPAPTTPAPTTPAPTGSKTTQDASSESSTGTEPSEQPSETTATPTPTKEIENITIDDKPIKPEDYEKKPDGSIELKPETIDELTLGVHRMRITYTDGSAITVEFEVVSSATRPGGKTVVKTGDTGSDRKPVVALLFIIVAAAALVILRRRTKKEKQNEI